MDVTQREAALCNADFPGGAAEREIDSTGAESLHSAITDGDDRPTTTGEWLARFGDYCTPPALLTERRPAVEQMRLYARRGRYTEQLHGPARRLGLIWLGAVAVPALVVARFAEWVLERPARCAVAVLTVKALSFLPPVVWLVDHVISPGADAALWLFL
ncbi:hypothetical protein DKT68_15170 [Micromonospora acroterricola]|uniref:Uncharacterized protein n=1 Tax=Micromonospora acroterricola TaxID=2202421 RepID=A0A317D7G1_9ACTN|nr:hypothetical protein DKT68_15170 [Micromonospora acroterricola]